MTTWYRWLVVAVIGTALVAFLAGAAMMGNYAHEQQKQNAAQRNKETHTAGKGVVEDVPAMGDATKRAAQPVVHPLCQGATKARDMPLLGPVLVFTVDGVARASGTGGCTE